MKKLIFLLILLAACAKEQVDERMVQLSVQGTGTFKVTYGTSCLTTEETQWSWTSILPANTGDTVRLFVETFTEPATIYLQVDMQDNMLYWRSMYIESNSKGSLNYIVDR